MSKETYKGIIKPKIVWSRDHGVLFHDEIRMCRYESQKYEGLNGDWKKTTKEAKASYKEKLKEYLKN